MSRKLAALAALLFLIAVPGISLAAKAAPAPRPFSITLSKEWIELDLPFQHVLASYGRKGTLATFHITVREMDGVTDATSLKWEDLFSPQFPSVEIRSQGETLLGGERAKYCIYTLRPGEFKTVMEGKLAAKYINYVLIHQGKLYSITFKDTEDGFAINYPAFNAAIRTLRFSGDPSLRRPR